jgi:hypothetical protein
MSTFSDALGNWLVPGRRVADLRPEDVEHPRQRFPEGAHAKAAEHQGRKLSAALPGHEYLRAGGSLRIGQDPVFLDDQRAPQRHHHQDTEDAAAKVRTVIWK